MTWLKIATTPDYLEFNTFMPLPHSITLGLWPVAGVTTVGVSRGDAIATIQRAMDLGVRRFDTAMSYGYAGESDRYLEDVLASNSDLEVRISSKVGQRYENRARVVNGRPEQLLQDARETVSRCGVKSIDLMYLHCIDPGVPIDESAGAMNEIRDSGLANRIGICNVDHVELHQFNEMCRVDAIQCPLNMMQT
ncbi:MAG: aldo/keto reductase, partial [Planctomycetota bacterium]